MTAPRPPRAGRWQDEYPLLPAGRALPSDDQVRRDAALVICDRARDQDDARHLLEVTGLLGQATRFYRATPRDPARPVRNAHAKRGRAS